VVTTPTTAVNSENYKYSSAKFYLTGEDEVDLLDHFY